MIYASFFDGSKNKTSFIRLYSGKNLNIVVVTPEPKQTDPLKNFMDTLPAEMFRVKKPPLKNHRVSDLKYKIGPVNLKARVLEIPQPKAVFTRYGTHALVSNVLIADETGSVRMTLWNQQIKEVSVDDVIKLEKGKVGYFRGERQLKLGRRGSLSVIEEDGFPTINDLTKT